MKDKLIYNGKKLIWQSPGSAQYFNATSGFATWVIDDHGNYVKSGLRDYQNPSFQCVKPDENGGSNADRAGPIPEGKYHISLKEDPHIFAIGNGVCALTPSSLIQRIPRGGDPRLHNPELYVPSCLYPRRGQIAYDGQYANGCDPYWANWGEHRVRLEPDAETAHRIAIECNSRGGFYLHDSHKGFTHGCIEVEPGFFVRLQHYVRLVKETKMLVIVKYAGDSTYGNTANIHP
jgi:hypothetical protein